ncbi:MAG: hypothetical protein Q7S64_01100 [bacterium]|nr:hypothetical protein [bacterium]
MNGKRQTVVEVVTLTLFLLLAALTQWQSDMTLGRVYHRQQIKQIPPVYYPTATAIRQTDLGFHRASADLVWLALIQYFGGGNPNQPYLSLVDMLNTVVDLDPSFEYPYLFGGVILPWQDEPQAGLALLNQGIKQYPNNGLLYYYAGSTAKIQLDQPALAATYFQQAIGKENTPPAAAILAGVSLTELDNRDFARTWWQGILDDPKQTEVIKDRAKVWLGHLDLTIELERLIAKTNRASDVPIKSLDDLVTRGILKSIPRSPLEAPLIYNPTTGRVDLVK